MSKKAHSPKEVIVVQDTNDYMSDESQEPTQVMNQHIKVINAGQHFFEEEAGHGSASSSDDEFNDNSQLSGDFIASSDEEEEEFTGGGFPLVRVNAIHPSTLVRPNKTLVRHQTDSDTGTGDEGGSESDDGAAAAAATPSSSTTVVASAKSRARNIVKEAEKDIDQMKDDLGNAAEAEDGKEGQRARAFIGTMHGASQEDMLAFKNFLINMKPVYFIFGLEKAPRTGSLHFQCFIYFKFQHSWNATRKNFKFHGVQGWLAVSHAIDKAIAYCKKDGNFIEWGVKPIASLAARQNKGGRQQQLYWDKQRAFVEGGCAERVDSRLQLTHGHHLEQHYLRYLSRQPLERTTCKNYWLFGRTRTGKSYTVRNMCDHNDGVFYLKLNNDVKWFHGYQAEPVVIWDDVPERMPGLLEALKTWCDGGPFKVETKGSVIKIRPRVMLFTSNFSLQKMFPNRDDLEPILERIDQVFVPPLTVKADPKSPHLPTPDDVKDTFMPLHVPDDLKTFMRWEDFPYKTAVHPEVTKWQQAKAAKLAELDALGDEQQED